MSTSENRAAGFDLMRTADLDNRTRTRIPDLELSEVRFSTPTRGEQSGQLEDISLGGFTVSMAESYGFSAGHELVACFDEGLVRARVIYVVPHAEAGCRVGLEWSQPKSSAVAEILARCLREIYSQIVTHSEP